MNAEEVQAEHKYYASTWDFEGQEPLTTNPKSTRIKKLGAQALLDCVKLDDELG